MKRLLMVAVLMGFPAIASAQDMRPRPGVATPVAKARVVPRPAVRPVVKPMARPKARAAVAAPVMASIPKPMVAPMAKPKKAVAAPMAATPAKKRSKLETATKWIEIIGGIAVGLLTLIGGVLTAIKGVDWRKGLKGKRWDKIQYYTDQAFDAVEGVAGMTKWKGDDKLIEYLKRINLWLKGEGKKPLTDAEKEAVKLAASDRAARLKNWIATKKSDG